MKKILATDLHRQKMTKKKVSESLVAKELMKVSGENYEYISNNKALS